jgi:hypothetical protein
MRLRSVLAAVAGTILALAIAFVGSAEVYHRRRFQACTTELEAAVQAGKTYGAFLQDTRPDGLYRRVEREERNTLRQLVSTWRHAPEQTTDLERQADRASSSAIFFFGDMVYVLFFDNRDRIQDFICLSN